MKMGPKKPGNHRAVAGEYLPPSCFPTSSGPTGWPQSSAPAALVVEDYQHFIRQAEQKFYDWCIDLLDDSGVVGVLNNERLYLDSALSGQLHVGDEFYYFELSRTSVNFASEKPRNPPIRFSEVSVETEGTEIEATQVGKAFVSIRRQSILNRVWASVTSLASRPAVAISDFRLGGHRALALMEIETSLGECTVSLRSGPQAETFRYSVFQTRTSAELSPRIADAVLADVAEDLGVPPLPESILDAMIGVAERVRTDQGVAHRRNRSNVCCAPSKERALISPKIGHPSSAATNGSRLNVRLTDLMHLVNPKSQTLKSRC